MHRARAGDEDVLSGLPKAVLRTPAGRGPGGILVRVSVECLAGILNFSLQNIQIFRSDSRIQLEQALLESTISI